MSRCSALLLIALLFMVLSSVVSIDNGVGFTPPMGWNGWNYLFCNTSQQKIKEIVDTIIQLGFDKKGYQYINVDDCWQIGRNHSTGQIIVDSQKFPSGMEKLGQYIHNKGLKFGIYSDAGYLTCQQRPGSFGFQEIDAKTYAKWKVDYLKYDNCYNSGDLAFIRYSKMQNALNQTNRPIFFSICNWGQQNPSVWGKYVGNAWRTTEDIQDKWDSFIKILDPQQGLQFYSGNGGWNDPDMLHVGNGGMSFNQYQAHFIFWCALKAPLLIGCDLNKVSQQIIELLGNEQLIAINQDMLGIQVRRIKRRIISNQILDVYGGPLSDSRYLLIFFNRGRYNSGISISLRKQVHLLFSSYAQRDPVRHQTLKESKQDIFKIPLISSHSVEVRILKLKNLKQQNQKSKEQKNSKKFQIQVNEQQ